MLMTLGLTIWPIRTSDIRPFIPVQSQPAKIFVDQVFVFSLRSFLVSVFDANDVGPASLARKQPCKETGADVTHVQQAGGTRGKSCSDHM